MEVFIVTAIASLLETEHYGKKQKSVQTPKMPQLTTRHAVVRVWLVENNIAFR